MELSTYGKVCSVYSTQEILPVSNFGQLHAHPPPSAIEMSLHSCLTIKAELHTVQNETCKSRPNHYSIVSCMGF